MCRLYGLHANEPTRVECSLVRAQNALMEQSRKDQEGFANAHGWGLAAQSEGAPGVKGPGLIILIPLVQQMVRVDLRVRVLDVPTQDVISHDNVSVRVSAVVYFRVIDPERATIQVENFMEATSELAQTTLRSVLGKHDLDEMLAERDKLNHDIQEILDSQTDAWGVKVANVEIKHVDIDQTMVRAIARQAEAERERRAKIINAEGEAQAAQKLLEAATILSKQPEAMQLRYLSTLNVIAGEKSSTIVFPFPVELSKFLAGVGERGTKGK